MTTFDVNTAHRSYRKFSDAEAAIIRDVYPQRGVLGVLAEFAKRGIPDRGSANIRNFCHRHGIRFTGIGSAHADETQAAWVKAGDVVDGADRLAELSAKPNRTNAEEVEMINREIETL